MYGKKAAVMFVVVLHCAAAAGLAVEGQEISISKNLTLINSNPAVAVSTKTGDVLAAWNRYPISNPFKNEIYIAFCKKQGDGTYFVSKP